ncbi:lyase family protein [Leekyejoonella antrihumi]|uniref:3-carboxy-cis,cis-muconate cycloisomerase n=1 Tax=Leekyejoonella antrihumi TaxID=1660198 RepID=A0A563E334_9MICO|nr:lyase family protein [Leekyejoonella antrihumi]TWP36611.1 3-carboxy-cis,cis-muconate cycloisomerase [Leekyejoonella antrihumi]
MSDLFSPGDDRAGNLFSDTALMEAMVAVEQVWLNELVSADLAPAAARQDLTGLVGPADLPSISQAAEAGGNPLIPLLQLLRERLQESDPLAAQWLHRGLTSQDVVDTALVVCCRDVADRLGDELKAQTDALAGLAVQHERSVMAGRTLTQHAAPISFGLKAASWLTGVLDARDDLDWATARLAGQFGGAVGSSAAVVELARRRGIEHPERTAVALAEQVNQSLGLAFRTPWHTARAPITRFVDALVGCTAAYGRIAGDVLVLARPEIAELGEPLAEGRGGSSTMPHKTNPILSTLITRTALSAPATASIVHLAAAGAVDERPGGAWHAEWPALRTLARGAVAAGSQTTELVTGLRVDTERMRCTAQSAAESLLAERRSIAALFDEEPTDTEPENYLGAAELLIDAVIDRARHPREDA